MSTKAERGMKRTCQNPECGSRFYDLNRVPIVCPICESAYRPEASALSLAAASQAVADKAPPRKVAKKPVFEPAESAKPDDAPDTDDGLPVIEGDDEEAAAGDDDETFLEAEEEDGSDMSNIIGGPVAEPDEPQ
jgi:uncharacterized protein (TIGR02300 family)